MIRAIGEVKRGTRLMGLSLAALLAAAPVIAEAQGNPASAPAADRVEPGGGRQRRGPASQTSFHPGRASRSFSRRSRSTLTACWRRCWRRAPIRSKSYRFHRWLEWKTPKPSPRTTIRRSTARNWDPAVKALARFPDVIKLMSADLDWTTDLGDAEVNQPQDVADVIQELRVKAEAAGTLKRRPQQAVRGRRASGFEGRNDHLHPANRSVDRLCPDLRSGRGPISPTPGSRPSRVGAASRSGRLWTNNYWNWGTGWIYPPVWAGYGGWSPPRGWRQPRSSRRQQRQPRQYRRQP